MSVTIFRSYPAIAQSKVAELLQEEGWFPPPQAREYPAPRGVADLLQRIDRMLPTDPVSRAVFRIPHEDGSSIHMLHEYARVLERRDEGEYSEIVADTPDSVQRRLARFRVQ